MDSQTEHTVTAEAETSTVSPSRIAYNQWRETMSEIDREYPQFIKKIRSPDELNGDLTLEQIDERWEYLGQNIKDAQIPILYEAFKDYLTMPRFTDSFPDSTDGHSARRKLWQALREQDKSMFDATLQNDLRLTPIQGVIESANLLAMDINDESIRIEFKTLRNKIVDSNDPDKKETYSHMSLEKKIQFADEVRNFARELYFSDPPSTVDRSIKTIYKK